ncbi:hypothetical protein CGZ98_03740 [Enemella evansiae]|nr:hypothetical protein CGZ98_03740 [Enemella evansiae]
MTRPPGPWVGVRDVTELKQQPDVFWLGAHGGAGTTTLRTIAAQRDIASITTRRWPRYASGELSPVVLVARTHAVGLWHVQRVVQEWASGMVDFVDLHGLVLLPDAPGAPPKDLREQIASVSALVPLTWTISWQPRWRTVVPGSVYPLDARTKLVMGRIRRSLHKKQAPTTT